MGHSMGGFGTWAWGTARPELWAAISIHSGGARTAPLSDAARLRGVAVRVWHGSGDSLVPVAEARAIIKALRWAGITPEVEIVEGHGHSQRPDDQVKAIRWLMQWRREG